MYLLPSFSIFDSDAQKYLFQTFSLEIVVQKHPIHGSIFLIFRRFSLSFDDFHYLSTNFLIFRRISLPFDDFPYLSTLFLIFWRISLYFNEFPYLWTIFLIFRRFSLSFVDFPYFIFADDNSIVFRWLKPKSGFYTNADDQLQIPLLYSGHKQKKKLQSNAETKLIHCAFFHKNRRTKKRKKKLNNRDCD